MTKSDRIQLKCMNVGYWNCKSARQWGICPGAYVVWCWYNALSENTYRVAPIYVWLDEMTFSICKIEREMKIYFRSKRVKTEYFFHIVLSLLFPTVWRFWKVIDNVKLILSTINEELSHRSQTSACIIIHIRKGNPVLAMSKQI